MQLSTETFSDLYFKNLSAHIYHYYTKYVKIDNFYIFLSQSDQSFGTLQYFYFAMNLYHSPRRSLLIMHDELCKRNIPIYFGLKKQFLVV